MVKDIIKCRIVIKSPAHGDLDVTKEYKHVVFSGLSAQTTNVGKAMTYVREGSDMMMPYTAYDTYNSLHMMLRFDFDNIYSIWDELKGIGSNNQKDISMRSKDGKEIKYNFVSNRTTPRSLILLSSDALYRNNLVNLVSEEADLRDNISKVIKDKSIFPVWQYITDMGLVEAYEESMLPLFKGASDFAIFTLLEFFIMHPQPERMVKRRYGAIIRTFSDGKEL